MTLFSPKCPCYVSASSPPFPFLPPIVQGKLRASLPNFQFTFPLVLIFFLSVYFFRGLFLIVAFWVLSHRLNAGEPCILPEGRIFSGSRASPSFSPAITDGILTDKTLIFSRVQSFHLCVNPQMKILLSTQTWSKIAVCCKKSQTNANNSKQ